MLYIGVLVEATWLLVTGLGVCLFPDMVDNIAGNSPDSDSLNYAAIGTASGDGAVIKEQDRLLPIANVGRIMKQILPPNAKISKEAKETMQECVSEFISFVTGEASDKCQKEKRKTVNGDDICWALGTLGFDDYAEPLRRYLQRYRELEGEKASSSHGKASETNAKYQTSPMRSDQAQRNPPSGSSSFKLNPIDRNDMSMSRPF